MSVQNFGEKKNWVDSDDLSMMFKGSYTNEFYRVLRDALHAEVNSWKAADAEREIRNQLSCDPVAREKEAVAELWAAVEQLERTCRSSKPTLPSLLACVEAAS